MKPLLIAICRGEGEDISHRNRWLCTSLRSAFPQESWGAPLLPGSAWEPHEHRKVPVECLNGFRGNNGPVSSVIEKLAITYDEDADELAG